MNWNNFKETMLDDKTAYVAIMFKKYDTDEDGEITKKEREEMLARVESENPTHAQKLSEFFSFMMANFDADNDGIVSKDEFLNGVRNWMIGRSVKVFNEQM